MSYTGQSLSSNSLPFGYLGWIYCFHCLSGDRLGVFVGCGPFVCAFLRHWEAGVGVKSSLSGSCLADVLFTGICTIHRRRRRSVLPGEWLLRWPLTYVPSFYSRAEGWSWHYRTDEQQQWEQLLRLRELLGKRWRQLQQRRRGPWPRIATAGTPAALQQQASHRQRNQSATRKQPAHEHPP